MCGIGYTLGNTVVGEYTPVHFHIEMNVKGNASYQMEYRNYEGRLIKFHSDGM